MTQKTKSLSDEEMYFEWLLDELKDLGYIESYFFEPEEVTVTGNNFMFIEVDPLTRKTKILKKDKFLLASTSYTPDYVIKWSPKAKNLFYLDLVEPSQYKQLVKRVPFFGHNEVSIVEIKANFDNHNMTRAFQLKRVALGEKFIYVNLVKIPGFFKDYFITQRYLFTNKTSKKRKINFDYISLKEYIEEVTILKQTLDIAYKKKS